MMARSSCWLSWLCGSNKHRELVIVFIAFMVVGSYLMMNLFVGVILDNFNSVKDRNEGGISVLTDEQKVRGTWEWNRRERCIS